MIYVNDRSRQVPVSNKTTAVDIGAIERVCGLTERQIQSVIRCGIMSPTTNDRNARYTFSFQQILVLRKIGQWISAQCSFRSILTQLHDIVAYYQPTHSLSALAVTTIGPYLVVKDSGCYWHVTSGQAFLDFDTPNDGSLSNVLQFPSNSKPTSTLASLIDLPEDELKRILTNDELTSDDWFNLGIQFESMNETARARSAYRNAIGLDEDNIDAYINLGRLLQLDDKYRDAKKLYEKVLQLRPDNQLANYNLGTLFDMLDEIEIAVRYYQRASNIAMAHHNLARIYEHLGNDVKAARHLSLKHELEQE